MLKGIDLFLFIVFISLNRFFLGFCRPLSVPASQIMCHPFLFYTDQLHFYLASVAGSLFRPVHRQREDCSSLDLYLFRPTTAGKNYKLVLANKYIYIDIYIYMYIESCSAVVICSDLIELWYLIIFHMSIMNKNVDECLLKHFKLNSFVGQVWVKFKN